MVVRNQKTPYSCVASIRGYDRRSSKGFFFADQDRTPRVSGGPRWAAGKETSAEAYHPSQAAQRSRATAKALALLGGLRSGANESGVKRALAEFEE